MVKSGKNFKPVILITGANGQVGWELQRTMSHQGNVVAVGVNTMDLSSADSIVKTIRKVRPDIIINPAAYTAVDNAEKDIDIAKQVNAIAPGIIAEEASRTRAFLIHYSTDYVFDGSKDMPYMEDDVTCPLNVYGETKLRGEQAIEACQIDHLIFRTSWVYASRGKNFLLSILRLAKEREHLNIVGDQIGSPTWARLIAEVSSHALQQSISEVKSERFQSSTYNLVSSGSTSWHGFAEKIVELARSQLNIADFKVKDIKIIPSSEYPTPAKRPMNSCLNVSKVESKFGLFLPTWDQSLELCMKELL